MIYKYVCWRCSNIQERNCPIDDRDKQVCHECGERLIRRYDVQICIPRKFATENDDGRAFATSGGGQNHEWIPSNET